MINGVDLLDIQGNIVKAYGRYGFPVGRFILYSIDNAHQGRAFVGRITPFITTAEPWSEDSTIGIPPVAINIAFTFQGLKMLDVPGATLQGFQDEYSMGMKARREILADTGPNDYKYWDPVWNDPSDELKQHVHILIGINAFNEDHLAKAYDRICAIVKENGGILQLEGHRGPRGESLPYQPAAALPGGKEHFGYSDGISNAFFKGCGENPRHVIGGGKPTGADPSKAAGWAPLETGEFILGHPDEASEYPEAPGPPLFSRNGTFMVFRKLHQNVASFESFLNDQGGKFPDGKEAFAAKLAGRWRNGGAPLVTYPTQESADAFAAELYALFGKQAAGTATKENLDRLEFLKLQWVAFDYNQDTDGARCPFSSHIRRANPRSFLQFGEKEPFDTPGSLSNRRRILRRGLPYGKADTPPSDHGDHGIVMMIINADISRQFEFVQQQWFNYGNDFRLSNDQDPFLGNHGFNQDGRGEGRMIIEGDAKVNKPPFFCGGIPTLVETRGGDYFFVPSLTCLRMIALGIVDPT